MPNQKDRIRLVVPQVTFDQILLDAGIGHRSTYDGAQAFVGSLNQFGRLLLAAHEVLGPYDAQMLAACVRHIDTGVGSVFYFPGLELS